MRYDTDWLACRIGVKNLCSRGTCGELCALQKVAIIIDGLTGAAVRLQGT